jgi:ribosomal protein S18 acetylase RimI-like enzyme
MGIAIKQSKLTEEIKQRIFDGFAEHSIAKTGINGFGDIICLEAHDEATGEFMGVVAVMMFWGQLHIKYLFVEERFRGKGVGKYLMDKAFKYAKEHNCTFAFLETMSFQALKFYEDMGFELQLTRSGYAKGVSFHYMQKDLTVE